MRVTLWILAALPTFAVARASLHDLWQLTFRAPEVDFTQWHPPTGSDLRSPCPCLNSLANHGFLPRDGRNISLRMFKKALKTALNVGHPLTDIMGGLAIKDLAAPGSDSINLDQLVKHGTVEHDASMSRDDTYFGDNHSFQPKIFDAFMNIAAPDNAKTVTIAGAAAARWSRVVACNATNPQFQYSKKQVALSYGETALFISTLGHPVHGNPPADFVKVLFENERLPFLEGWRPTHAETNLLTMPPMIYRLKAASPPEAMHAESGGLVGTVREMLGGE